MGAPEYRKVRQTTVVCGRRCEEIVAALGPVGQGFKLVAALEVEDDTEDVCLVFELEGHG
jgi:hypothetical protein